MKGLIEWDGCSYFFRLDEGGRVLSFNVSLCWYYSGQGRWRVADVDVCRGRETVFHRCFDEVSRLDEALALRLAGDTYLKMLEEEKK